ncbi:MAG: XdhC family protein [Alphaproteobacteria bacterium]
MKREYADAALAARAGGGPVAVLTDTGTGAQSILRADGVSGDLSLDESTLAAARQAIVDDRSGTVDHGGGQLFVHVFNAPLRMIIVGAVHIAQALAPMAGIAGYAVTVVDPRGSFATVARFPGVTLSRDWPDEAMRALAPDTRTAVVTLTHDPKLDDPALEVALKSGAFYIGCLGSRKTHGGRLDRLTRMGFGEADLARIHGPLGLPLGGKSPAEIAVATMAQITQVLHGREAA